MKKQKRKPPLTIRLSPDLEGRIDEAFKRSRELPEAQIAPGVPTYSAFVRWLLVRGLGDVEKETKG